MSGAICIDCGFHKKNPNTRCGRCRFIPKTDRELAKSMMLSEYYEVGGVYRGKTWDELVAIASLIEAGNYQFDESEVDKLVNEARKALNLSTLDQIKFIGGPILAAAIVIAIIVFLFFHIFI